MKQLIIIFIILLGSSCASDVEETPSYLRHVGDILHDDQLDAPDFEPCHEDLAAVYYSFNNSLLYKGEKPALRKAFDEMEYPEGKTDQSGYITIRFMVNCEGRAGRFRVEQLDFNYQETTLDPALVEQVLKTTKALDGWIPATYKEDAFDYYRYLTFKIINNRITEILP